MAARNGFGPFGILAAMALWLGASGCGSDLGPTLKVNPVKGKVTLGEEPLADAVVTLTYQGTAPKDYAGSGGTTDAQGNFEILTGFQKGAPAGTYKITVSKIVGADGKPIVSDPESGMDKGQMMASDAVKELVPPSYSDHDQSTQTLTITDGTPVPDLNIVIPKS